VLQASSLPKWVKRLLAPEGTLSERVVYGGIWVFVLRITNRLFGLARTIVLARLLAPADFGLFGIALLAMSALETFSQTGFQQALIHKKDDIKPYLDTAWTAQAIRGLILAIVLFGAAPYVAAFFGEPTATPLLRVVGLSMLFQGFTNIGVVYFQKELEFHKQFVYMFSGTLADLAVSISAALILKNGWALVFGLLAGNLVRMVVSYIIHPYQPRLSFNRVKFRELFGFGKWVLGSSILIFLLTQGDDIFVGKLLGVTALGFYQLAYRISNIPATEITHVISQVTFPAYSKLQDDIPKLREAYLRVLQVTTFLSFPVAGLIFLLAPDFTKIFLGKKWMPMVPAMQILVIFGATRSLGATMGSILYAVGKPKIQTKLSSIQLIVMAMIIYPLTIKWGILGTALAVVISNVLALILITIQTKIIINTTYSAIISRIVVSFLAVVLATLFTLLAKSGLLSSASNPFNFLGLTFIYGVIYSVMIYLWRRRRGHKLWHECKPIFSNWGKEDG